MCFSHVYASSRALSVAVDTPNFENCDYKSEFALKKSFIATYSQKTPPFGYNGLGELVYLRTYSRDKPENGGKERWFETVERVVNGTYQMQLEHAAANNLPWNSAEIEAEAQEMYERIFEMKFLPPGRGLWAMGTSLTRDRKLYAALNNCAFVSTEDIAEDPVRPFCFLMDSSMLGIGCGFDTAGAGKLEVKTPQEDPEAALFVVPDTREGWVASVGLLLEAYLRPSSTTTSTNLPRFDYSQIRPQGQPIKGFGGTSQGPEILMELHASIVDIMSQPGVGGNVLSVTTIVDIMNLIGKCVVSGNIRRTAEIAFGESTSEEFGELKDYNKNPSRAAYGWTSNNSIFAHLGMDYSRVCEKVIANGEPGFAWLDNMRSYGRLVDGPNNKDAKAQGGNPCLEQTLESFEMCCLVETFPHKHENREDFLRTLELAFTYAKTVTLGDVHIPETREVMRRNRRVGTSMSGLAQFVGTRGLGCLRDWCEAGYATVQQRDAQLSKQFAIPTSIKTTSIKPSGTVSLLAGATPGLHFPESRHYLRRMRLARDSPLADVLAAVGLSIESAIGDEKRTVVVSFPVDAGEGVRSLKDVSMWEQLSFAAFLQRFWSDNQVSCTVTFDPETEGRQLARALDFFQYHLKGVSFLPRLEKGAYPQMPYEAITSELYQELSQGEAALGLDFSAIYDGRVGGGENQSRVPDQFCDSDKCTV